MAVTGRGDADAQDDLLVVGPGHTVREADEGARVVAHGLLAVQGSVRDRDALPDVRRHGALAVEHRVDVRRVHRAGPYQRLAPLADGVVAAGRGRVEAYGAAVE